MLAALLFALFADLSATMRNHRSMRYLINPVNSLYALVDLAAQSNAKPAGPPLPIGQDARIVPRAAGALATAAVKIGPVIKARPRPVTNSAAPITQ